MGSYYSYNYIHHIITKIHSLLYSQFLMPGMVDTHIHAPQYMNAGTGYDKQLLEWLKHYTYPAEQCFKDLEWAKKAYPLVVVSYHAMISVATYICSQDIFLGTIASQHACSNYAAYINNYLFLAEKDCSTWDYNCMLLCHNTPSFHSRVMQDNC